MDKDEIKVYLNDNVDKLIEVLEKLELNNIKVIPNKRIECALPDSSNKSSVQIMFGENLSTKVWNRNEFDKYSKKDIYTLVEYLKGYKLPQAIAFVCEICGIKHTNKIKTNISDSYEILKQLKRVRNKSERNNTPDKVIDENILSQFVNHSHTMFLQDGISSKTQEEFQVMYDLLDNRIVFPIRNQEGELLSIKGRTCDDDYKIKGIPKYIYYYSIDGKRYLYGHYENYFDIISKGEVLVFEAEKSVQQCDSFNVNNTVAISKKIISDEQIEKLIKMGVDVVLAFDKGVELSDIFIECRKFRGLCNVYYLYDYGDLLEDKMSPSDKGEGVFMNLYNNYKFKYNGE